MFKKGFFLCNYGITGAIFPASTRLLSKTNRTTTLSILYLTDRIVKKNSSRLYVKLPIFLALAVVCGVFIGAVMSNKGSKSDITSNYLRYMEVLTYVNNDYVDSVNLDDLVDYSIDKMLEKLDPHTAYIPKKDVQIAHAQLEGDFEGIGIEFNIIKDTIYVVAPISGGPSEQVGLLAGDKIVKVGDKTVAGVGITTN